MQHKYKCFAFIYIIYIASSFPPKHISLVVSQSLQIKQGVSIKEIVWGIWKVLAWFPVLNM